MAGLRQHRHGARMIVFRRTSMSVMIVPLSPTPCLRRTLATWLMLLQLETISHLLRGLACLKGRPGLASQRPELVVKEELPSRQCTMLLACI